MEVKLKKVLDRVKSNSNSGNNASPKKPRPQRADQTGQAKDFSLSMLEDSKLMQDDSVLMAAATPSIAPEQQPAKATRSSPLKLQRRRKSTKQNQDD